jgi:filamentous hemagglutinin
MNKHLFRVVFNKARGLLMVVAENVKSACKAPGTTRGVSSVSPVTATTLRRWPFRRRWRLAFG